MINAGVNELSFEPKMAVNMAATGETGTPEALQPIQGPLANLRYKPTKLRFYVRLSGAPTVGTARLELRDGANVIKSVSLPLTGVTEYGAETPVSIASVAGENKLSVVMVVDTALDAGITATVDSVLSVEIPVSGAGNC